MHSSRWPRRWLQDILIMMVRLYQVTLSPILGNQCRYLPTCSNYFIEAVAVRGPLVGTALGIWRILRCNPFAAGGYDPVPAARPKLRDRGTK